MFSHHLRLVVATLLAAAGVCPAQPESRPQSLPTTDEIFARVGKWLPPLEANALRPMVPAWLAERAKANTSATAGSALARELNTLMQGWEPTSPPGEVREAQLVGRLALALWRADAVVRQADCPTWHLELFEKAYYRAHFVARKLARVEGTFLRAALARNLSKQEKLSIWEQEEMARFVEELPHALYLLHMHCARRLLKAKPTHATGRRVLRHLADLHWDRKTFRPGAWVMQQFIFATGLAAGLRDWVRMCRFSAAAEDASWVKKSVEWAKWTSRRVPANARDREHAGQRLLALDDVVAAMEVTASEAKSYEARTKRAFALLTVHRWVEARREFRELLKENATDARPLTGLGLCAARMGEYETAKRCFGSAAGKKPHDPVFYELQAWVFCSRLMYELPRTGRFAEIKDDLIRTIRGFEQALPHLHSRWGEMTKMLGFVFRGYRQCIAASDPSDMAGVRKALAGLAPEILAYRDKHPDSVDAQRLALVAALFLPDRSAARRTLASPLPSHHHAAVGLLAGRAEVYFALLEDIRDPSFRAGLDAVLEDLPAASGLRPMMLGTFHAVLARHANAPKQWQAAERMYRKVLAGGDDSLEAQAWNNLGVVLARQDRQAEAIRAFDRAAALSPDCADIPELNKLIVMQDTVSRLDMIQRLTTRLGKLKRRRTAILAWLVHLGQAEKDMELVAESSRKILLDLDKDWVLVGLELAGHGLLLDGLLQGNVTFDETGWPRLRLQCRARLWLQELPPLTLEQVKKLAQGE